MGAGERRGLTNLHDFPPDCLLVVHLYTTAAAALQSSPDCLLIVYLYECGALRAVHQPHHEHQPPSSYPAAAAAAPLALHPAAAAGAAAAVAPSYAAAFSERLRGLEQKAVAREAYWRGVVTEVQRAHASDAAGLRMQCSRAVRQILLATSPTVIFTLVS